jgi:ubiquinone/menaquinone biosynthesis C-methylase UbiE
MSTTNTSKVRYEKDYKDGKFGGPAYTHRWIIELLKPRAGGRLLDVGCSQGNLLAEASRAGLETYGVDISDEAIKRARENSPSSETVCGDAHKLAWGDGYFDYITNIGSLEHFLEPEKCLKEMKRVLKPGGKACIMLPNLHYYRHVINKAFKNEEPTSYQEIERFASLDEWSGMLRDNGFEVEKVHKYNKFNRSKWLILLRSIVVPLKLSHHFVFICGKGE